MPALSWQLPHERALAFAAVMAAAEARAFLQPHLHTLNPVCRTQGELSGKVPKSVCSAVFSMHHGKCVQQYPRRKIFLKARALRRLVCITAEQMDAHSALFLI